MDWKELLGGALFSLASRRINDPLASISQGYGLEGATLRDETFVVESSLALLKQSHFDAADLGDEAIYANAAGELANGLELVKNWALALQTGIVTLAADHPLRHRLEPLRLVDRDAAELAGNLLRRASIPAAKAYLESIGTFKTEAPATKPSIAPNNPPPPAVLETPSGQPKEGETAEASETESSTEESASESSEPATA